MYLPQLHSTCVLNIAMLSTFMFDNIAMFSIGLLNIGRGLRPLVFSIGVLNIAMLLNINVLSIDVIGIMPRATNLSYNTVCVCVCRHVGDVGWAWCFVY